MSVTRRLTRVFRSGGGAVLGLCAGMVAVAVAAQSPTSLGPSAAMHAPTPAPAAGRPALASTGSQTAHALTAEDVSAYLDGYMPFALQSGGVPGAIVVVVKDGQPLFERGYGYADVAARKPIDPAVTLFRPGSISKTFMWTAVMQLVQAGKLDLDRDVNDYLDFRIAPAFGRPITLRDLMTHSPGFGDTNKNLIVLDPKLATSLRENLVQGVPQRIFPPGTTPAYSNYGAALAGYIVQRVSGQPFADYIAQHIFAPLDMRHASFQQPLPPSLAPDMAKGYELASDPPQPFEYISAAPAGALSVSGDDMAHYMIAHLQDGEYDGRRILDARTAQLMHSPHFNPIPTLPGMAFGFYQEPAPGHRVIGHMGDTELFHSDLHLFLDDHVGLFVSLNGGGSHGASYAIRKALYRGFLDRYFPSTPPNLPTWPSAVADGRTLAGLYVTTRRSDASWLKLGEYLFGASKITADKDGVITVSSMHGLANQPKHWREVGPFQYQEVGGRSRLVAVVRDGRPVFVATDDDPPVEALQPMPAALSPAWNMPLFQATLAVLFAGVLTWVVAAFARRRYGRPFPLAGTDAWLYRGTRLACLANLVFLLGWVVLLQKVGSDIGLLTSASDPVIRLLQLVGVVGLLGALVAVANVAAVLRRPSSPWAKVSSVLLALACCATAWFAFSLHLLSWSLAY